MNVLKVSNATVRGLIEEFTSIYTLPDRIQFVQDGLGNWVVNLENLKNMRYKGIRQDLKQFLNVKGIVTNITSIKEVLQTYGEIIVWIPPLIEEEI